MFNYGSERFYGSTLTGTQQGGRSEKTHHVIKSCQPRRHPKNLRNSVKYTKSTAGPIHII